MALIQQTMMDGYELLRFTERALLPFDPTICATDALIPGVLTGEDLVPPWISPGWPTLSSLKIFVDLLRDALTDGRDAGCQECFHKKRKRRRGAVPTHLWPCGPSFCGSESLVRHAPSRVCSVHL